MVAVHRRSRRQRYSRTPLLLFRSRLAQLGFRDSDFGQEETGSRERARGSRGLGVSERGAGRQRGLRVLGFRPKQRDRSFIYGKGKEISNVTKE